MDQCEVCGEWTDEELEECAYCGRLYCPDCGDCFCCHDCWTVEREHGTEV